MGILGWTLQDWFNLVSIVGVIASLWIAILSFRSETKTRRIANHLSITANHREIWKEYLNNPKLARIRDADVDTVKHPVTHFEQVYVTMVVLHISNTYYSLNEQLTVKLEGFRRDIAQFLSLPIPGEVWEKIKVVQNDDFVAFIESCRNWK